MCGKKSGYLMKRSPQKNWSFWWLQLLILSASARRESHRCRRDAMMESTPCQGRVTISGDVYQINGKEVGRFFSGGEKLEISWFVKGWNSHEQWGFFLVIRCYIEQLSYETTLIIEVNGMVIVWFNSDIICYNGDITIKHDWMMSFVVRNHQQT